MTVADLLQPAHIKAFSKRMSTKYGSTVFDKNVRAATEEAQRFAVAIGAPNPNGYLKSYAFTLGLFIWYPFDVVDPKPVGDWTFAAQLMTIAHEHVHVRQWKEYKGTPFAADYITSSTARAMRWEAEAYSVNMEMYPVFYDGWHPDPYAMAGGLKAYGCLPGDVRGAAEVLRGKQETIKAGGSLTDEARELKAFLREAKLID